MFVEVRMRRSDAFGGAVESITVRKRAKLLAAARHYLARHVLAAPRRDAAICRRAVSMRC